MKQYAIVNFLRGYSIFTIVLMHLVQSYPLPGWLLKAASFGGAGVHVFILCSGFGLYLSYLHKPLGYGDFLKKRFGRIYWPMAVLCLLTAVWMLYQGKEVLMPLLGNLLLFKMFVPELETSMGEQMWFVSTIIQFYLAWPLILKIMKINSLGYLLPFFISMLWATTIYLLGYSEERVWNSFFLQYLWEFCLGIKLAELYSKRPTVFDVLKWKYLLPGCIIGIVLAGIAGLAGFPWKLYNDIPSLIGYTSLALILYKIGVSWINCFFNYTNRFSYEWYLVHILVFQLVWYMIHCRLPITVEITICFGISYVTAILYAQLFSRRKKSNNI